MYQINIEDEPWYKIASAIDHYNFELRQTVCTILSVAI